MSRTVLASITLLGVAIAVGEGLLVRPPIRRHGSARVDIRSRQPCPGALLVRPDGSSASLRQARQITLHGHGSCRPDGDAAAISIDAGVTQNLGVRLATVSGPLASRIDAVGVLEYNARDVALVQTRAADGFVERVYRHAPGDLIEKGAPLADLLIPEWAAAQEEYLACRRRCAAGRRPPAPAPGRDAGVDDQPARVAARSTRPSA